MLWGVGRPRFGRALSRLLEYISELGVEVPEEVLRACRRLDRFYTPTRYPDVWCEGVPEDYYVREDAEEAIKLAECILSWVEGVWGRFLRRG